MYAKGQKMSDSGSYAFSCILFTKARTCQLATKLTDLLNISSLENLISLYQPNSAPS